MVEDSGENFKSTCSFDFKKETKEQSKRKKKKGKAKDKDIYGICNKRVSSKYLRTHIASVHEGKKPFKCSRCNYGFASNGDLNRHISAVHEGKKPYKCIRYSLKELGLLDSVSTLHIRPGVFKEFFRRFLAHFLIL